MGKITQTKHSKQAAKASKPSATSPKAYNPYLDVLKGFAIVLVVLGHTIQDFAANGKFDDNFWFRVIYSFHMPLFMFLSGAAAAYSLRPMNFEFLKRKFYMLVIPFVAWYLIGYYLGGAYLQLHFKTYIHHVIDSPDYGLWFLWVLFLNFCGLALGKKLESRFKLYGYALVWLVIYALPTGKYGIGLLKWHFPFFVAGYLIFRYRQSLHTYRAKVLAAGTVLFPLLVVSWHRLYYPGPLVQLQSRLAHHHVALIPIGDVGSIDLYQIIVLIYRYLVAFAGICFVYWLFQLRPAKYLYPVLGVLGIYTLDVYVSHGYFFRFAVGHSGVRMLSGFVIALSLSIALGFFFLRRVPWLSAIFLGGRSKTTPLFKNWPWSKSHVKTDTTPTR